MNIRHVLTGAAALLLSTPAFAAQWLVIYSGTVVEGTDGLAGASGSVFGNAAGANLAGAAVSLEFTINDSMPGASDVIIGGTRRLVYGGPYYGLLSNSPLSAVLTINGIDYSFGAAPGNWLGQLTIDDAPSFDSIQGLIQDFRTDGQGRTNNSFVSAFVASSNINFVNSLSFQPLFLATGGGFQQDNSFRVDRGTLPGRLDRVYADGRIAFSTLSVSEIQLGAVPEPTTWTMVIAGFGVVGARLRRRSRRTQLELV
jgi:PEP-CTERM motif